MKPRRREESAARGKRFSRAPNRPSQSIENGSIIIRAQVQLLAHELVRLFFVRLHVLDRSLRVRFPERFALGDFFIILLPCIVRENPLAHLVHDFIESRSELFRADFLGRVVQEG